MIGRSSATAEKPSTRLGSGPLPRPTISISKNSATAILSARWPNAWRRNRSRASCIPTIPPAWAKGCASCRSIFSSPARSPIWCAASGATMKIGRCSLRKPPSNSTTRIRQWQFPSSCASCSTTRSSAGTKPGILPSARSPTRTTRSCPEALEKWPLAWFEMLLPRQLEIIYEINRRFLENVRERFPGNDARIANVSLIEEGEQRKIRMANLAIVGSHSTNGVAAIHSELLKQTTVKDLAEIFPDRFSNKTNGVTPRRWLLLANPPLARAITDAIGKDWITDLSQLERLTPLADDANFQEDFRAAKRDAKTRFVDWLKATSNVTVDPDSIFDSQVKRIHEYKRQLLNALRIVVLYNRLRENPKLDCPAAHIPLRRQSGAGLSPGEADHQIHQQSCRHHRWRPGHSRPPQGGVPARLQRCRRRKAHSRQRRLQSNFHCRLRSQRHQQHEVHDERRPHHRHARRRHDRNGRRSGRSRISSSLGLPRTRSPTNAATTIRVGITKTSPKPAPHST